MKRANGGGFFKTMARIPALLVDIKNELVEIKQNTVNIDTSLAITFGYSEPVGEPEIHDPDCVSVDTLERVDEGLADAFAEVDEANLAHSNLAPTFNLHPTGGFFTEKKLDKFLQFPNFLGEELKVYGGSILAKPDGIFGINMTEELECEDCSIHIPTRDFSVPSKADFELGLVKTLLYILGHPGHHIYVGCMGGIGRTGMFMTALTVMLWKLNDKVGDLATVESAIQRVRHGYEPRAVETKIQEDFLKDFDYDFIYELLKFFAR